VQQDGLLAPARTEAQATLTVRVKPEAPAAMMRGEEHLLRAIEVRGDPRFADALHHLVRHLRWDFEADLSRVFGDIVGYRLAEGLRAFAGWQRDAALRLAESAAAYATDEKGLLVRRQEHEGFAAEVAILRDAVDRLEQRVRRLGPTP
jgi:ubiquinone biosynthesis accessory factor UbiJ